MGAASADLEVLQNAEQRVHRVSRQEIGPVDAHEAVTAWMDAAMVVDTQLYVADKATTTGYRQRRDDLNSSGRGLLGVRHAWNGRKHPKSEGELIEVISGPLAQRLRQLPQMVRRAPLPPGTGMIGQQINWVLFSRLAQPRDPKAEQERAYRDCLEGKLVPETVHVMSQYLHGEAAQP